MNRKDRVAFWALLEPQLPEGYKTDGEYDDFVNRLVDNPMSWRPSSTRVLRIVGPQRYIVLFDNVTTPPVTPLWGKKYAMRFLHTNDDLVVFGRDLRLDDGWLASQGARTFTGRGWKDDLAMKVPQCITRWERHYSGLST